VWVLDDDMSNRLCPHLRERQEWDNEFLLFELVFH